MNPGNHAAGSRAEGVSTQLSRLDPPGVDEPWAWLQHTGSCSRQVRTQLHAVIGNTVAEGLYQRARVNHHARQSPDSLGQFDRLAKRSSRRIDSSQMDRGKLPELLPEPPSPALNDQYLAFFTKMAQASTTANGGGLGASTGKRS